MRGIPSQSMQSAAGFIKIWSRVCPPDSGAQNLEFRSTLLGFPIILTAAKPDRDAPMLMSRMNKQESSSNPYSPYVLSLPMVVPTNVGTRDGSAAVRQFVIFLTTVLGCIEVFSAYWLTQLHLLRSEIPDGSVTSGVKSHKSFAVLGYFFKMKKHACQENQIPTQPDPMVFLHFSSVHGSLNPESKTQLFQSMGRFCCDS